MYVPIVLITITPVQNALRPAIEKTERTVCCPVYMVNCFRKKWGHTAHIATKPVQGDELWLVPKLPSLDHAQSEITRIKQYFKDGGKAYERAYPNDDDFIDAFSKVAVEVNPRDEERAERDEEHREAAVKRASLAVMQAAGDAEVQAQRKRGGRPAGSKNKPREPSPV